MEKTEKCRKCGTAIFSGGFCEECYMETFTVPKVFCKGCGVELTYVKKFDGLYCNQYCCGKCCPDAKTSPCQKEQKFGTMFDELKNF